MSKKRINKNMNKEKITLSDSNNALTEIKPRRAPNGASKKLVLKGAHSIEVASTDYEKIETTLSLLDKVAEAIKKFLKPDIDMWYGPKKDKPSLLISGAEKVFMLYNLRPEFEIIFKERDRDNGVITYTFKCKGVHRKTGAIETEGYGSYSNLQLMQKGDPFKYENIIIKMAEKSAFIDSAKKIGNLSKFFTQDIEDMGVKTPITAQLNKDEKLALYQTTYSHFKNVKPWSDLKVKDKELKDQIKKYLSSEVFPKLEIPKSNFLAFDKKDADIYLEWLKDYGVEVAQGTFKIGE